MGYDQMEVYQTELVPNKWILIVITPVIFFVCNIFNVCGSVLEFAEKMPSVSETAASIYVNWWANEIKPVSV